jgi:hypothetical protein
MSETELEFDFGVICMSSGGNVFSSLRREKLLCYNRGPFSLKSDFQ